MAALVVLSFSCTNQTVKAEMEQSADRDFDSSLIVLSATVTCPLGAWSFTLFIFGTFEMAVRNKIERESRDRNEY